MFARHQTKAEEEAADPAVVAELQREVEDLKLRLHMAAEHYKEKYKECQRLQKQVLRLSEQQGVGSAASPPACSALVPSKRKGRDFISYLSHYICLAHLAKYPPQKIKGPLAAIQSVLIIHDLKGDGSSLSRCIVLI